MEQKPLVSIVIPVYNGDNYVREAIDSALAQTYQNVEIVVVNDGSTDGGLTRAACLEYGDRIQYFEKENGGCASALNYGVRMAKGEFISWLSHDDLYYPEKVAHQINCYLEKGLDMKKTAISNRGALIDGAGNPIYHPNYGGVGMLCPREAFRYLLFTRCFNGCGLLLPKAVFELGYEFPEHMRFVLDFNLWLKLAAAGVSFYVDDKILVANRQHSGQVTVKQRELHKKESAETRRELFALLKEHEDSGFLLDLYYSCCCADKTLAKEIKDTLKKKGVKSSILKKAKIKAKHKVKKCLKKVYHKLRK